MPSTFIRSVVRLGRGRARGLVVSFTLGEGREWTKCHTATTAAVNVATLGMFYSGKFVLLITARCSPLLVGDQVWSCSARHTVYCRPGPGLTEHASVGVWPWRAARLPASV